MYKFDPRDGTIEDKFRALALSQLDEALADLERPGVDARTAIHEARRRCKKLRGLLRLVRPAFADFAQENSALRDAAALLSHLRDADVLRQTISELAGEEEVDRRRLEEVARRLAETDDADAGRVKLTHFAERMQVVRARAASWSLGGASHKALLLGLKRTYRSAAHRMRLAAANRDPRAMHEWRKASKNHGFHIDLLKRLAPDLLADDLKTVERLATILGRHHDLSVLTEAARQSPERFGTTEDNAALAAAVDLGRRKIEAEVFPLGRQVFAETPRAVARRFAAYWKAAQ